MSTDLLGKYKRLLSKEQQLGEKYVIIDKKWFEHWKRSVGLDESDEENKTDPGPINFTELVKSDSATNQSKDVQLRDDAVEGNDFTFIPYELYKDLKDKYTVTGPEIIRTVVPRGEVETVIETFLVPLRICESKNTRQKCKQIYRSRQTYVDDIKKEICNEFRTAPNSNYRLLTSDETNADWEVVEYKAGATLDEIDLTKNAFLTFDSKSSSPRLGSALTSFFKSSSSSATYTPGLCGLSNLGNTCFMNSALQCLSNVPPLTQYFLQDEYKKHVNRENPLGMKGDVAEAYGQLIHEMWSGRLSSYAPKTLKHSVARYAPQFSGYAQQDSQEFMSFLLDGLHEDLNRVKQKPYMDKKDDDGKTEDAVLAEEQWDYYKKRNESKIQEIFHGQIKSTVRCLKCGTKGRTFDPICFLSLPLPGKSKMRTFKIDYIRLDGQIKTYSIKFDEHRRMSNLVEAFCEAFRPRSNTTPMETQTHNDDANEEENNDDMKIEDELEDFTQDPDYDNHQPKADHILMAEVYNHRVHLQYSDNNLLTNILDRDHIVFYETPQSLKSPTSDTILMPCVFREENGRANFGYPIYLTIPRRNCMGKDIQVALDNIVGNFLPVVKDGSLDKTLYTASCQLSRNYNQQVKKLDNILNEPIDFAQYNASLVCEVVSSVVEKYKQQREEQDRKQQEKITNSIKDQPTQTANQKTTLIDCFRLFTKRETLSTEDLWMCTKCKVLQRASKKIDLWLLPKVLIVQLKRFNYNRYFRDKIDQFIDCPTRDLDLSQFVLNPDEKSKAKYDLIAVSNHMGGLGGGHYTAYGKNATDKKWHSFDDSYVGDANEDNVITKSAYVLIYQQREPVSGDDSNKKSK